MGMYTELVLNVELDEELSDEVIAVLRHLADGADCPDPLPKHAFFECARWDQVLQMSSSDFMPFSHTKLYRSDLSGWYLSTRFDLKN